MPRIGTIDLCNPVMNAACSVAKSISDVQALCRTNISAIVVGSITKEPRDGNPEPRWFVGEDYALNSFGMPNRGLAFYRSKLPIMLDLAHQSGKQLVLNIAGFNIEEYLLLARMAQQVDVDMIELNFGCPNISQDGKQKPIVSFDLLSIKEVVTAVSNVTNRPLLLKLSPYSNPAELQATAQLINKLPAVSAIVSCNTFANGYTEQAGEPVLASGYGGVSGRALKAIGLGQVHQFRQALRPEITVIGVGGIQNKVDVDQYLAAGASFVQAASLIVEHGHAAINKLV